jgi:translocation and assembly module TamB
MSRIVKRLLIALLALLAVVAITGVLVLRSEWFREQVRTRMVREIEKTTGGRAEIATFEYDWPAMQAKVTGLVLHGRESSAEPPLFRAASVRVGLRILSALRRKVDLALIEVDRPEIYFNGSNAPRPSAPTGRGMQQFLSLAVKEYRIRQGNILYVDRRIPLDLEGRGLDTVLAYDPATPAYQGSLSARLLRIEEPFRTVLDFAPKAAFRIHKDGVDLESFHFASARSQVSGQGTWTPENGLNVTYEAAASVAEFDPALNLPLEPAGRAVLQGSFRVDAKRQWQSEGRMNASGLTYRISGRTIQDIDASGNYTARSGYARLTGLRAAMLGGVFEGTAELHDWKRYAAEGEARGFPVNRLLETAGIERGVWGATINGPVRVNGPEFTMETDVRLESTEDGTPVTGEVAVTYQAGPRGFEFGPSHIELAESRIHFQGALNGVMEVGVVTRDLAPVAPALRLERIPARIERGQGQFTGTWTGGFSAPHFRGRASIDAFETLGQRFDSVSADVDATAGQVRLTGMTVRRQGITVEGYGTAALSNWRLTESSAITAKLHVQPAPLETILKEAKIDWPVQGRAGAMLDIQGSYSTPRIAGRTEGAAIEWSGESFTDVTADFRYAGRRLEVISGSARKNGGRIEFSGLYDDGEFQARVQLRGSRLAHWNWITTRQPALDGAVTARLSLTGRLRDRTVEVTALEGDANIDQLQTGQRPIGGFQLRASTRERLATATIEGQVRGSRVEGSAEWNLTGASYGLGQLRFPNMNFAALHDLGLFGDSARALPFRGSFDAEVGFSGPVTRPDSWTGLATVTRIELEPNREMLSGQRFVLRNKEVWRVHLNGNGAKLESVQLTAEGTDLEATGTIAFQARSPWDLRVHGTVNLPVLSTFEPDLVAAGASNLDATIRGSLQSPNVTGRMEVKDASLFFRNSPNGLDKLNGVVVFDRTRANVEKLTAQSGGGELSLGGFIDFGGQQLLYRLQAEAKSVRVRYPEAVSTTFDANLNLTGTATGSVLGGEIVVNKMGITPRTDLGSLIAEAGRGASITPAPNDFLRNMQVDLRVVTSPDAELQTSLTRDIQPQANFRVRGTGARPVLLGSVSVNQGEIQFFGNQYLIQRGEITFANPVKNEPVLDMDLEARVRGIIVTINFSGPINRLDVSYRSDPPLQPAEIVALLAVGRTPGSGITPNLPSQQNQIFSQPGNNSLLGQAITAPFNSGLQRLFGVSRLKIDPELTGVTNTPQARLTIEQQLSRDITITYITNLNRTQQQIVRLQWDFSRDFSVLAVRDENGIFGIDFFWRKRFR